jgi:low temperature requirement protein LtrA
MVRTRLHAAEEHNATFVELFFDLVFVFAITQITVLTAHHLTPAGLARSLILFWLIWWAWTQFTWTLNTVDTTGASVRAATLIATGAAFVMATSVTRAFGDDAWWFAVPYVVVRVIGLIVQALVTKETPGDHSGVWRWLAVSNIGLVVVLIGAAVPTPARTWIWLLAIGIDLVAATGAGSANWELNAKHFSERHGLFVIIALGESMIVAATAVAGEVHSTALTVCTGLALAITCTLWWTYFGWLHPQLEHAMSRTSVAGIGRFARDVFSLGHFPVICGIIAFAVAIEEIVIHPDEPLHTEVLLALGAGVALFVGCSALSYWRATGQVLVARLAILAVTLVALGFTKPFDPAVSMTVVLIGVAAVVLVEELRPPIARLTRADTAAS